MESSAAGEQRDATTACPVCDAACHKIDEVDFNKSCEDHRGRALPRAGIPVEYVHCGNCGFCFAPALCRWSLHEFSERIYNDEYELVDPHYVTARPTSHAGLLLQWLGDRGRGISHLDYGGGHGLLSDFLRDAGWNSRSYDPFFDRGTTIAGLGRFDLITALEVFEHVPDVNRLVSELDALLKPEGLVIFSTVVSDGQITAGQPLSWWYAAPRNGHISLYSRKSLELLAAKFDLNFRSYAPGLHGFWHVLPGWTDATIFAATSPSNAA
jgi:SAM-dependent methyltransferase